MRVLLACEFSGVVRDAFLARGHDAYSCDLLPTERKGPHVQADVFQVLFYPLRVLGGMPRWMRNVEWDLMIHFYPCFNMAVSGARWFHLKREEQERDVRNFVRLQDESPVPRVAGENPIGVLSTKYRKPDQIVQPWMFGHGETKATCIWRRNLPELKPTKVVDGREGRVWREAPSPDRWKRRSRTLPGIGEAMAEQWGSV